MAKKLIVAVHGIGDQFRYETVQAVANQVCRYYGELPAIPLGRFFSKLYMPGSDAPMDFRGVETTLFQIQQMLAGLAKVQLPVAPAPPVAGALVLAPPAPPHPVLPADVGFAEVYWANVPRKPAKDEHILEESKKWARTVVGRVRACFQPHLNHLQLKDRHYVMAATVIEEMIEGVFVLEQLLFLAEKAGVLKFNLKKLLVDYLGDVQVVTEFAQYREQILTIFNDVLKDIHQAEPEGEIHIVAHSEGTVIAFLGMLRALSQMPECRPPWIDRVRGFMTIGSPINKHLILWPELWLKLNPQGPAPPADNRIEWRNYYDYGDPVGFELTKTRAWLEEPRLGKRKWTEFFAFEPRNDFGFARYPFPGKAHTDYWEDEGVFGHFINTVIKPELLPGRSTAHMPKVVPPPRNKWLPALLSPVCPYLLAFALCFLGVYLLYKGVLEFLNYSTPAARVYWNVFGLTSLLAGLTVATRIPRLSLLWRWWFVGWGILAVSAVAYWWAVDNETKGELGSWVSLIGLPAWAEQLALPVLVVALAVILSFFPGQSAKWGGAKLLVIIGSIVIFLVVANLLYNNGSWNGAMWPLLLASAAFLYLWWLSALLFELTFFWHRYIRWSILDVRLRELIAKEN